jgi:3-deoxy-D-manno-octulosonic-acid transferase
MDRGLVPEGTPLEEIDISDVDVKMLNRVTTDDLLAFVIWLSRSRKQSNSARARHIASLKSFFKYLHSKRRVIDNNPAYDIETPKIGKRMPKYLTLEQSRELLASLGHRNVTVVGDTRFDRVLDIRNAAKPLPLVERFAQDAEVFVAGSSWPPDEALFIPWFLKRQTPSKLIIAPHQIGEDHLRAIEAALDGRRVLRYSDATEENVAEADILIINCFGLLSSIYRYGRLAMVGGGFGVGIHNVPEAAVYGIPVLIGPNNQNFREARYLLDAGACFEVHTPEDFAETADRLMSDTAAYDRAAAAARQYIAENAGASDVIFHHVFPQAENR